MTDVFGLDEGQQNKVILLALILKVKEASCIKFVSVVLLHVLCCIHLVNGCDFLGVAYQRIRGAPFAEHVSDQSLLAIVGGQD